MVENVCHFSILMRLITGAEPIGAAASRRASGQSFSGGSAMTGRTPMFGIRVCLIRLRGQGDARQLLELGMVCRRIAAGNEEISAVGANGKIECRLPGPASGFCPLELTLFPQDDHGPTQSEKPCHDKCPDDEILLMQGIIMGHIFYQHERFLEVWRGKAKLK